MGRTSFLLLATAGVIGCMWGCDATGDEIFGGSGDGGDGGAGGSGAASTGGLGGDLGLGGQAGGDPGNTCVTGADEDADQDGWTVTQGDCNDCDPNVSPGAIEVQITEPVGDPPAVPEPADEDCDGMIDNVAPLCDGAFAVDDIDPMSAAGAMELCQMAGQNGKEWGLVSASYVRANGNPISGSNQMGILNTFGTSVNPQGGAQLLVLSSGRARVPGQTDACGSFSCSGTGGGTPPTAAYPQNAPGCPIDNEINDDVGFEVTLKAPTNATGYTFNFKFYSFEYPEWVCTSFNDQFMAFVQPPPMGALDNNISFDSAGNPVSVNVAFFDVCPGCPLGTAELNGTGFDVWDDAGGTAWLQTSAPITGGDQFSIRFGIWDTGDSAWDSTVLIDNFQWVANGGTVAIGTEPIPDPK